MQRVVEAGLHGLAWSARRGSVLLAAGIFGGILVPPLAAATKWFITPNVLLMTTLVLLRVDLPATLAHLRRPGRLALIVGVQLLLCPVLAWLLVAWLPIDPGLRAAVVIFATGCAATSGAAFARLVGLDPNLTLLATLMTLALVPLTAPPMALGLLGIDLSISTLGFMGRLLVVVGLPMLLSLVLRQSIGPARLHQHGDAVDGALVLLVVLYGFAVMDGMTARAFADPAWVATATAAAFTADYGLNLITTLILLPLGVRTAATAGLMSGNRNMALFLAVLPAATDPRITLFFGLCQLPLFLSPFLLRPIYRKVLPHAEKV